MVSQIIDVTDQYNATQSVTLDVSLWDKISVQIVGTFTDQGISAYASNDGGAVQSVSDGGPSMAKYFTVIQLRSLYDESLLLDLNQPGIYSTTIRAKYFKLSGAPFDYPTTSKVIVFLNKPY